MLVICILRIAVSFKIFFPLNVLGICQPVNMKEVAFINNIRQALYFPLALLSDLSPTLHWSPRELPWLPPGSSELVSQGGSSSFDPASGRFGWEAVVCQPLGGGRSSWPLLLVPSLTVP